MLKSILALRRGEGEFLAASSSYYAHALGRHNVCETHQTRGQVYCQPSAFIPFTLFHAHELYHPDLTLELQNLVPVGSAYMM